MKKLVNMLVVISVLFLFALTVQAQDLCDEYYIKYQTCLEQKAAGSEMDYNVCRIIKNQSTCEAAGCTWHMNRPTQSQPCMLNICQSEVTGDAKVTTRDYGIFSREYGRYDCPRSSVVLEKKH